MTLNTDIHIIIKEKEWGVIPLLVNAHVSSMTGKIRIFFSKNERKGWYAYVTRPVLKIDVDPILGTHK